jgi:Cu+-exporting ATPase
VNGLEIALPGSRADEFDAAESTACFHCGLPVRGARFRIGQKAFCCQGCQTVFELLTGNGMDDFYRLSDAPGVRIKPVSQQSEYAYLDHAAVRQKLVDYSDERLTRVTFRIPSIHCIACVWLLENLFRLKEGVGHSLVNFTRREASISFDTATVKLSEVATLLASLGYEPELKLSDLEVRTKSHASKRLWLQLGMAGFAFGNVMLLSIAYYFGLDGFSGPGLKKLFAFVSLGLTMPVVFYSAADYWKAAWLSVRRRFLTIEVPIAIGIAALTARSLFEVLQGRGEGYFDSLSGLVFFLLCGKLFQQRTYDRLAFDRDYKSFFPLSITRRRAGAEERVALSELAVGDRLVLRNGELIPSDARLVGGAALIDYSFVTGESEPVAKTAGDHLYAGGRQMGGAIEVEALKAVSQSYLTSLWNQPAFQKEKTGPMDSMINVYSKRFTVTVIGIALAAAGYWSFKDPSRAIFCFTAVLIVACPCALALAAPFTLGSALRALGRRNVFLKNTGVIESLARIDTIVFDKTGTLTAAGAGAVVFHGAALSDEEQRRIFSLAQHSTHPAAVRIGHSLARDFKAEPVRSFSESAGCGMEGIVGEDEILVGSAVWLASKNIKIAAAHQTASTVSHVAINGKHRGCFELANALRPETARLLAELGRKHSLALLSGDNEGERARFGGLFGPGAELHFNQSPVNKLGFIAELQRQGRKVMMVGDGLNDAGALRQSDVGVAVVESAGAFSPASDAIMSAGMVPQLDEVMRFSRASVWVVRLSFGISALYNVAGISIAACGLLRPIICALLMPVSSITVVLFACFTTNWLAQIMLKSAKDNGFKTTAPAQPGFNPGGEPVIEPLQKETVA